MAGAQRTRYESHQWDATEDDAECIVCGVTWQECDDDCPGVLPDHQEQMAVLTDRNARLEGALRAVLDLADAVPKREGFRAVVDTYALRDAINRALGTGPVSEREAALAEEVGFRVAQDVVAQWRRILADPTQGQVESLAVLKSLIAVAVAGAVEPLVTQPHEFTPWYSFNPKLCAVCGDLEGEH